MFHLTGVRVERIVDADGAITIEAASTERTGVCPECHARSNRVHSRYRRTLRDLPSCGRPVRVRLTVRRFLCRTPHCPRRTFVEQIVGATAPHRRTTLRLEGVLLALCVALGGEAGARLAGCIGVTIGGDALLRLLRRAPLSVHTPRVLGVDDWAWRRGKRSGSVLIDLEKHRPVDLLADRTAATLEQWLVEHPGVEVIVRDRWTDYAYGAERGAPEALHVVDRWHVLRNIREVAERLLARHSKDLRTMTGEKITADAARRWRSVPEEARREAVRRDAADLHTQIHRLASAGGTIAGMARQLGMTRTTVRRYLFADVPPDRDYTPRSSLLERYIPYLRRRWAEGCHNALQLWREIRAQGYPHTSRPVSRWAEGRRPRDPAAPKMGRPRTTPTVATEGATARSARRPSVTRLAWVLVCDPARLDDDALTLLGQLQASCPAAATAYPLLQEIGRIVRQRTPKRLDRWFEAAASSGLPDLVTVADGLRRERAALVAALTLPWSTGPVEGHITRLKLLKRQGYGRAGLTTRARRFVRAA